MAVAIQLTFRGELAKLFGQQVIHLGVGKVGQLFSKSVLAGP